LDRTEKNYGIGRQKITSETDTGKFLLLGCEGKDIKKLKEQMRKTAWACWRAISTLGK
jgi:hypothetical protein